MKKSEAIFGAIRVPLDATAAVCALYVSYLLREARVDLIPGVQLLEPASTLPPLAWYLASFSVWSACTFVVIAALLRLYVWQTTESAWRELGRIVTASLLWVVCIMGWYFLVEKQLFFSRILLLHSAFFLAFFVSIGRVFITIIQRSLLQRGIGVRYVISIGSRQLPTAAKDTLARDARYAYLGHAATLTALKKMATKREPDLVLQTDANPSSDATVELIDFCRSNHLGYAFLPPVFADVPHLLSVERLGLIPMLRFCPTPLDGWGRIFKRLFDLLVSIALILVLLIPMLIIAIFILIDSGLPIFYVSKRVGTGGKKRIPVLKFRSMIKQADAKKQELIAKNHRKDGPLFKVKNDPRITRVGAVLRRWSIDEWPQLFNVFVGHMSLVGPRPHLPEEVTRYSSYERRVFAVKPGATGLAQISGRSDLNFDQEVTLDLSYIEEWSLLRDVWILWRTLVVVCKRDGAD